MRKWLARNALWLEVAALLLLFDMGVSSLATCIGSEQQQAEQCAEKGYGLTQAVIYRVFFWFIDKIRDESELVVAAATIVIALFTVTLWRSTEKMWKADTEQLRHSDATASRQLGHYVYVDSINVLDNRPDHIFRAELVIKNFGQTPAYGVTAWVHFDGYPTDHFPGFVNRPVNIAEAPVDVAPGQVIKLDARSGVAFSAQHYAAIASGNYLVYVYGDILYWDTFWGEQRRTQYRMRYAPGSGFNATPEGNHSN